MEHLWPHELAVLDEIQEWCQASRTARKGLLARIGQSLEGAYRKVPESVRDALTHAISQALQTMQNSAAWMVSKDSVYEQLRGRLGPFDGSATLLRMPIRSLDRVALDYMSHARTGVTIEGAAAGVSGLIGLVADIPFLYCMLFKMIQELALCYGFPIKPPQERAHMMKVLDVGHDLGGRNREVGMEHLLVMEKLIRQGVKVELLEDFEPQVGTHTQALTRQLRLARQLAFDLIQRKLMQTIVLVGGVIGAASNFQLAGDVGTTAFHVYRRRFLMEVGVRRMQGVL